MPGTLDKCLVRGCRRVLVKNMTRVIKHRIIYCLICLLLSGCGTAVPAPKTPETTITFACSGGDLLAYQLAAEAFHRENPALTVRVVSADTLTSMESATLADIQANVEKLARGTDVFVWPSIAVEAGPRGVVRDLGPFMLEARADAWLPGALAHFRWQGKQWGIPAGIDPLVVIYAPAAFEQAGALLPSSTWTWDDLRAAARKLTQQQTGRPRRFGFVDHELDGFAALLAAQGLSWDERQAQVSPLDLTDPRVAAASRWYADLVMTDRVMPEPTAIRQFDPLAAVQDGEAGMAVAPASWFIYYASAEARQGLRLAPLPGGSPALAWGYFISAGSAHPDAAWRWLAYASQHVTPERQLPAARSWASQLAANDATQPAAALLEEVMNNLLPPIRPILKEMLLKDAVRRIMQGENAATVLTEAQQQALAAPTVAVVGPFAVNTPPAEQAAAQTITFAALNSSRYAALVQQFQEESPEIGIILRNLEPADALASAAPSADCFHLWGPPNEELRGQVRNLQPFFEAERTSLLNDYYQSALAPVRQDGTLWGLPAGVQLYVWWYNRALFDKTQTPYPAESWTWDDVLTAARRLASGKGAETQYGFVLQSPPYALLNMLFSNTGFRPLTMRDATPIAHFDDPYVVALATELADLARANAILREDTTEATSRESAANAIRSGRVAMWLGSAPTYRRYANDFYPAFLPHTGDVFWPSSSAYYISAATQSPLACWKWLRFLADQMPEENFLPARRSVMASPTAQQRYGPEAQRIYMKAADALDAMMARVPEYPQEVALAQNWLAEALDQIIWQGADPSTALAAAQQKATVYFECLSRCATPSTAECVTNCRQTAEAAP